MSDPLKLNGELDSLVLGGLQVFGVPSPPRYVLANGEKAGDFTYRTDTQVSFISLFDACQSSKIWAPLSPASLYIYLPQINVSVFLVCSLFPRRFWQWLVWPYPCQRCLQSSGFSDVLNVSFLQWHNQCNRTRTQCAPYTCCIYFFLIAKILVCKEKNVISKHGSHRDIPALLLLLLQSK